MPPSPNYPQCIKIEAKNSIGKIPLLVLTTRGDDVIILGIFSKVPEMIQESWIKVDELTNKFPGFKRRDVLRH